jgi:hypothetical protein
MTNRKQIARLNRDALAVFVFTQTEIEAMLAGLQGQRRPLRLRARGDQLVLRRYLERYAEPLKRVIDSAFKEASTPPAPAPRGSGRRGSGS